MFVSVMQHLFTIRTDRKIARMRTMKSKVPNKKVAPKLEKKFSDPILSSPTFYSGASV